MTRLAALLAIALALWPDAPARGADPRNPDWPCVQAKVPEISVAAVWAGPSLDDVGKRWEDDAAIKSLVTRLAARRTPLEDAQKTAAEFIAAGGGAKQERGRLLFAGLFETLNRTRSEVMGGIERYTRRQREFAEQVRSATLKLRALQDAPTSDPKVVEQAAEQLQWETRIFEERRRTINYVCEVPVLIEQRLFALGRAIQQAAE
jgi:hypothetical protein